MDVPYQVPITPEDDDWHGGYSNHWFETETHWWSWNVPERNMGGWIHHAQRVNQHNITGGLWTWDDSDAGALYEVRNTVPYERSSLRHGSHDFGTGLVYEVVEPLQKYRTVWTDPGRCEADLTHEGIMAPHSHPEGAAPLYANRHIDQACHVYGTVTLYGEDIAVDCLSVRDRSWGPRPAGPVPPEGRLPEGVVPSWKRNVPRLAGAGIGYVFATESDRDAFMAFTAPRLDEVGTPSDDVTAGYLVRDGRYAPLAAGSRIIALDPVTGFIDRIRLDAVDALDRRIVAEGVLKGHHGTTGPGGTGMFHWTWTDGRSGYGEDQSSGAEGVLEALAEAAAGSW